MLKSAEVLILFTSMKIITLNIQHGGGRRIAAILDFLAQSNADVMVLSEYQLDDKNLSKQLMELEYKHQIAGSTLPKENSVLIAAKEPFDVLGVSQRIVSVRLNHLVLFGVYFPQREEKYPVFKTLKSEVKAAGSSVIIIGDFNTGLHYLDEAGKTFICADSFESLQDVGLIDLWRSRHSTTKEFSWFSNQGNGFRIDHAFCSESLNQEVSAIEYIHEPREMKFSDHSALALELNQLATII